MDDYNKTLELLKDEAILNGLEIPRVYLHKWLVLGQTDYLCEHGTLSDGHEKLTDAQKYAQAIKELYILSQSIKGHEILAKKAQADLIESYEKLSLANTIPQKLRAEADVESAKMRLGSELVSMEDQMRMARFYNRKISELKESVESKYPGGLEQAEADNWETVFKYRMNKERLTGLARERIDNVPLSPEHKAKLGYDHGRIDAIAPLMVTREDKCREIASRWEEKYLDYQKEINEVKNKAEA